MQLTWVHLHPEKLLCFQIPLWLTVFVSTISPQTSKLSTQMCLTSVKLRINVRIIVEKFYFTQKLSSVKVILCSLHLALNIAIGHTNKKLTSDILESVNSLLCAFFALCRGVSGSGVYPV